MSDSFVECVQGDGSGNCAVPFLFFNYLLFIRIYLKLRLTVTAVHGSPFEKYLHPFTGLLQKKKKRPK
jgi:hypothetical protein